LQGAPCDANSSYRLLLIPGFLDSLLVLALNSLLVLALDSLLVLALNSLLVLALNSLLALALALVFCGELLAFRLLRVIPRCFSGILSALWELLAIKLVRQLSDC
jgi:hypothetical protein